MYCLRINQFTHHQKRVNIGHIRVSGIACRSTKVNLKRNTEEANANNN